MQNRHEATLPPIARARNFPLHERVFPPQAVPAQAAAAAATVRSTVKSSRFLFTSNHGKPPWDSDTSLPSKGKIAALSGIGEISAAPDAEFLRRTRKGKGNAGEKTGPRAASAGARNTGPAGPGEAWNNSTVFGNRRRAASEAEENERVSHLATRRRSERLLERSGKRGGSGVSGGYVYPWERSAAIAEERRSRVAREREFGKEYLEAMRRRDEEIERRRVKRAEGKARDTSRWVRVAKHTGSWEYSDIEREYVWSCCMSADRHSEGCEVSYRNPDAWNVSTAS